MSLSEKGAFGIYENFNTVIDGDGSRETKEMQF